MDEGLKIYREEGSKLCAVVDRFEDVPVVVLGDLVLDEFLNAEIERVSREAPVLIVQQRSLHAMPGGGANAVHNLKALGGRPIPVGVVGADEAGSRLVDLLDRAGIETSGITVEASYETPAKTRVLAALPHSRPQQVVRIDKGSPHSVPSAVARAAVERASRLLDGAEALLLSDYGYDAVRPDLTAALIEEAREDGLKITCDSRHRVREFKGVSAVTPNLGEAEEMLGRPIEDDVARLREAGSRLVSALGADHVLITRGSRGMLLFDAKEGPFEIPVFGSDQVADVTGAGDTVIAAFTLALASGATPVEAALVANAAAGLVVMKRGTAVVTARELTDALRRAGTARG
ncbi:MAG: bifunctional hydroxymethylpyrimidine kinase/phosphomethylpyrimidine kinase [Acidobacteria bacterium]|nr:bifunctional hydroxymethylpyrimidine kinase/phosphomethylpyrimidine kinase [Acidobacteriota bacterium]